MKASMLAILTTALPDFGFCAIDPAFIAPKRHVLAVKLTVRRQAFRREISWLQRLAAAGDD
jgi:hypothetical protein